MNARRTYETTIILNAALEDQDIDASINKVTAYIENHGGIIKELTKWGRKRLAYPINKKFNGFYCHIIFDTMPDSVPVFERFLVLEDSILRHLTLILPDKLREYRQKRELEEGRKFSDDNEEDSKSDSKDNKAEKKDSHDKDDKAEKVDSEKSDS